MLAQKLIANKWLVASVCLLMLGTALAAAGGGKPDLFDRDNLVAWCIVPFDAARRGPEERAKMLESLGIKQLAYDWRDEHIPQFDEEVAAMKRHGVRITAWWMAGPDLNEPNKKILDVVRRHNLKMQFWVMAGEPAEKEQADKVRVAAAAIRPLAEEAAKLGCQVGLYNHGGWFGEPENQLAILEELKLDNVGIVYNLHHGHEHLDRFAAILPKIKPHLLALNLNGMTARGDQIGKKIIPIGTGDLDLDLLRTIQASGYTGPIGILNHTDLDAGARLADNLAGLDWLVKQLNGQPAGPLPAMQTYKPSASPAPNELNSNERASLQQLIAEAKSDGVATQGAAVFSSQKFACISCHRVGKQGGTIGPELTKIGSTQTGDEIVESLLWPKRKVKPEFAAEMIATEEGTVHQGYVVKEDDATVVLREAASCESLTLAKNEITVRKPLGTLMPDGLTAAMSPTERRDVVRFLFELGNSDNQAWEDLLGHSHEVAQFSYQAEPIEPANWRFAQRPVNRDRIYDFYSKEADYFRDLGPRKVLMPAFPGLDGGKLGHWGNQNEETWRSDRWNAMNSGPVVCGIFQSGAKLVARGVCVQLGGPDALAICFNADTLTYDATWKGGFLKYSPVRHGFVDALVGDGQVIPLDNQKSPSEPFKYRGYYRHSSQVIFAYEVGGRPYLDAPAMKGGQFVSVAAPADEHPLKDLTHGGPPQWPQVLETKGTLGADQSGSEFVIDSIELPFNNPWNALMYVGGHDFLPDGSAMVCTMQGDVWHVTGLDKTLEHVRWKRFATGLHHALGLVVANEQVYVLGRNQITRLHDLNGDDEADFYECFSQAYITSTAGHDFICGLERDAQGNFYTVSGNQGLLRISPDGSKADVVATGFRNPDGLGMFPDGSITVPCSEGEWTATSMICLVPANQTAGAQGPPHYGYQGPKGGVAPQLPLVYLPRGVDNSSGGQAYINSKLWGPLEGQMVHFSFGAGTCFTMLRDEVNGQAQGAVVPLPGDFASGAHRGRFHPIDGQLYVSGMTGWGSYTPEVGSFERVRYTGQPVQLPAAFHVHQNGIRLTFTSPVDATLAGQADKQFAQVWNYRYSSAYGSAEYAPSHFGAVGHDRLAITGAHILEDGRSVFLEMPDIQPVNQLHLRLQVKAGRPIDMFATVHALDTPFTGFAGYQPIKKTIAAHPLLADLAALANPPRPNPFREAIPGARPIRVEAGKNLTFATRSITVKAGEPIQLTFMNPDVVPHNWVLLKPDSLARVGELVNKIVSDPDAANRHYVPESDDVLFYTDIVPAGQDFSIFMRAPEKPGRYPFLCSFPGHWMVMNGQMIVE